MAMCEGRRCLRSHVWPAVLYLSFAAASCANASENLSACSFITQAEVEAMLGGTTAPPTVLDMNVCAGLCPSLNTTRCEFHTLGPGPKKELSLDVLLPPYEFSGRAERGIFASYKSFGNVQDIPGFGGGAFWYYGRDIEQSIFFTYPRRRAHFSVWEEGVEPHVALANAISATTIALKVYDQLKPSQLKNAWKFQTTGESHLWKP